MTINTQTRIINGPVTTMSALGVFLLQAFGGGVAVGEEAQRLPGFQVTERPSEKAVFAVGRLDTNVTAPDAGALLTKVPGANLNKNGPLSGIAQYRGMFGNRIRVSVDGTYINSGGPNWMDPPLHYAPGIRLDSLQVFRGVAPVSAGNETIGGYVAARTRQSEFTDSDILEFQGDAVAEGHTVDEGYSAGALFGFGSRRHRIHAAASRDDGNDYSFGDGKVEASEYERDVFDLGYGFRHGPHEVALAYRRNETDDTGTPALPMDIDYFNTDILRANYDNSFGEVLVRSKIYYTGVNHRMTNFHIRRPPADPARQRFSETESDGTGYDIKAFMPLGSGELSAGIDGHMADHDADIFNPKNAMFFVNNFRKVDRNVHGGYVQWDGSLIGQLSGEFGARYTRVKMNAGDVDGTPARMPGAPQRLRDRFNNTDRSKTDSNYDLVAKLFYQLRPDMQLEFSASRKTRSPSYQERYLWLPLQATGGLGDGNNYVGDVGLDPEQSYQAELGLDWRTTNYYFAPRAYYRYVDDYIQGTPSTDPDVIMVSTMSGDPTPLQFSNVEAKFYGIDGEWGAALGLGFRLDGIFSYVRGERDDNSDDLYRIAPASTTVGLTYERPDWSVTAEGIFTRRQNNVSETNEETKTNSFQLMNVYGGYRLKAGNKVDLALTAGVDNVLDSEWTNHLAGLNRVTNSDLKLFQRIKGPGRNFFARVALNW